MAIMDHAAHQLANLITLVRHGKDVLSIPVAIKDRDRASRSFSIESSFGKHGLCLVAIAGLDRVDVARRLNLPWIDGTGCRFNGQDASTLMGQILGHDSMREGRLGIGGDRMDRCPFLVLETHCRILESEIHKGFLGIVALDKDVLHGMREDVIIIDLLTADQGFVGGRGARGF